MEYTDLAAELLSKILAFRKAGLHQNIGEALRGENFILNFIACCEDVVLPGEISHEMDVSSARIAAALNRLEDKNLITRQIDKNDRRRILVRITPEGRELADKNQREVLEAAAKLLSRLDEHDAREYVRITGKLADIIASGDVAGA